MANPLVLFMSRQIDRARAKMWIDRAPDDYVVRFAKATRSDIQNRWLWPRLQDIQKQVPGMETYSLDDIKCRFMNALGIEMRFLPNLEGEGMFPVGMRSSQLTKMQFSGLQELILEYGARHGVTWSNETRQAA